MLIDYHFFLALPSVNIFNKLIKWSIPEMSLAKYCLMENISLLLVHMSLLCLIQALNYVQHFSTLWIIAHRLLCPWPAYWLKSKNGHTITFGLQKPTLIWFVWKWFIEELPLYMVEGGASEREGSHNTLKLTCTHYFREASS